MCVGRIRQQPQDRRNRHDSRDEMCDEIGSAYEDREGEAMSLTLLNRLHERDLKMLSIDRNVPEPLRSAARKNVVHSEER